MVEPSRTQVKVCHFVFNRTLNFIKEKNGVPSKYERKNSMSFFFFIFFLLAGKTSCLKDRGAASPTN